MLDRNYILNLVKSKDVTIEEFNYDKLVAPPIGYFFNQYDIGKLYEIASSLRYSAKPQVKYQEIDKIMKSRGFVKLSAGTNRVVYRCIENDTFVAKVAYDSVGLTDNPREFINQEYLKPFCAKTFEVTNNGVLAFSERLNPITNREEFLSVAESIFELITEFIIGEYVMDDIGTKYFMNYGMRKGFGPCILDYSFLYKLDGNKLYCNRPEPTKPEGKCLGEIDYDAGYNNLVCKKCGKIYMARDLELKVKENNIISKSFKGEFNKMKVRVIGGSKNYDVTSVVENDVIETKATAKADETVYAEKKNVVHVSLGNKNKEDNKWAMKKESKPHVTVETPKVKQIEEPVVAEEPKKEEVKPVEEKKLTSPIKAGGEVKTTAEKIRDSFLNAGKLISEANIKKEISDDIIKSIISGIKFAVDTARMTSEWRIKDEKSLLDIVLNDSNIRLEGKIEVKGNEINAYSDFVAKDNTGTEDFITEFSMVDYLPTAEVPEEEIETEEEVPAADEVETEIVVNNQVVEDEAAEEVEDQESNYVTDEGYEEVDEYDIPIENAEAFSADIIDVSTKLHNEASRDVIVVNDDAGAYLTVNGGRSLFVIDRINGMDVSEIQIVSKKFLSNILSEVDSKATELTKEALSTPESMTVNGVPETEE